MSAYLPWLTSQFASLTSATIKAMLLVDHTPDVTDSHRADIVADEVSGTGYTAGGVTVTGVSVTEDDTDGWVTVDCDDVAFGPVDILNITAIAFYISVGSPSTDVLICVDVFDATDASAADTFTYRVPDDGIMTITPVLA